MMSAVGPVGGGAGSAPSSVARALNSDAIFRIEVSLSSRRSTVIVMKCTARLYSLETVAPAKNPSDQGQYQYGWVWGRILESWLIEWVFCRGGGVG